MTNWGLNIWDYKYSICFGLLSRHRIFFLSRVLEEQSVFVTSVSNRFSKDVFMPQIWKTWIFNFYLWNRKTAGGKFEFISCSFLSSFFLSSPQFPGMLMELWSSGMPPQVSPLDGLFRLWKVAINFNRGRFELQLKFQRERDGGWRKGHFSEQHNKKWK